MKKGMKNTWIILAALVVGGLVGFVFEQFNIPAAFLGPILGSWYAYRKISTSASVEEANN